MHVELTWNDLSLANLILCSFSFVTLTQLIQTAFLRDVNMKTWQEAVTSYPHQTTRERLSAFLSCNFQHGNRPASLVAFAKAAVLEQVNPASSVANGREVTGAFVGLNGSALGHVLNMDILKVDDNVISKNTTNFSGFDLTIIDVPEVSTSVDKKRNLHHKKIKKSATTKIHFHQLTPHSTCIQEERCKCVF